MGGGGRNVILAALLAATSCTSFSGEPDRPGDAGGADSSDAGGAGGDAVAAARFCSSAKASSDVVFCADFEGTPNTPPFGFDDADGANGAFALVRPPDRPDSVVLRASMPSGSKTRSLELVRDLGAAPESGRVELELDVEVVSADLQYAALAVVAATAPEYAVFEGLAAYAGASTLGGVAPPDRPLAVARQRWHHVKLTIEVSQTSRVLTVEVNGSEVEKRQRAIFDPRASLDVRIGIFFTSEDEGGAEVLFDNVIVRRRT